MKKIFEMYTRQKELLKKLKHEMDYNYRMGLEENENNEGLEESVKQNALEVLEKEYRQDIEQILETIKREVMQ